MMLTSIRLVVPASARGGELVAVVERDGAELARLLVERPGSGASATYDYRLGGEVTGGPADGVEVAGWLRTGLSVRVLADDDAPEPAHGITLFVQVLRRRPDPAGPTGYVEYLRWHCLGSLGRDVPVTRGSHEVAYQPSRTPVLTAV